MIYTVEGFSKGDKLRCCNTTFVNAFPDTIREICNRVLGTMIFFENHTGREIADLTYLNLEDLYLHCSCKDLRSDR